MDKTKNIIKTKQNGQALLFVVVAATIALTVGVAVSTRTIGSIKRSTRTDTSARIIAVAEGGMENLLSRNYTQLDEAVTPTPSEASCTAIGATYDAPLGCVYYFSGEESGGEETDIGSRSIVSVERFSTNTTNNGYTFNLEPDSIREVSLVDFNGVSYGSDTMEICWDNSDALIYYYSYNPDGEVEKGGLYRNSSPYVGSEYISTFDEAVEKVGFGTCATVNLVDDHYGLRIKVLYEASKVTVYPTNSASLTDQGYRLTSKGELTQDSGNTEVATVIVYKTYPYAPSVFDYGIYTPGSLVTSE